MIQNSYSNVFSLAFVHDIWIKVSYIYFFTKGSLYETLKQHEYLWHFSLLKKLFRCIYLFILINEVIWTNSHMFFTMHQIYACAIHESNIFYQTWIWKCSSKAIFKLKDRGSNSQIKIPFSGIVCFKCLNNLKWPVDKRSCRPQL